ncbi:ATP-binding cassette domain-containing protein [Rhodococcus sp. 14-2483-1-1]|uniref:ATP-binding cassette domain-containing protein n=1 Tax=Rhodococcus sp. 14-2483-1-1 TaxID=2023148 RepID=UPI0020160151|nr:ATP-binding cassette domain-containing protein [Rhodococcus sp. 14-2483-1-1]
MIRHEAPAVRLDDVRKVHGESHRAVTALGGVSMDFARGSFTAIMGPSGSGKSTLLHCAAGLDRPTSGIVMIAGTDIAQLDEKARTGGRLVSGDRNRGGSADVVVDGAVGGLGMLGSGDGRNRAGDPTGTTGTDRIDVGNRESMCAFSFLERVH